MTSDKETAPKTRRLIIHHLSDLHYEKFLANGEKNEILVEYSGYLANLKDDRHPDLVVVTGDLTSTGKEVDLEAVADGLRIAFPDWRGPLRKRIYVVPGPNDVNWEGKKSPGLEIFYKTFQDFALPPLEGASNGRPMPEVIVSDAPGSGGAAFVGYPLDTCYSPDDLHAKRKEEITKYAASYEKFVKLRGKQASRSSGLWSWLEFFRKENGDQKYEVALKALRAAFLDLTEGAPPVALDSGRVMPKDIASFERWTETLALKKAEPGAPKDPLKILISHHALAIEAEQGDATGISQEAIRSFQQIANAASGVGFHLALHGHIHKPQVLSDLSILQGEDTQHPTRHPMRQIGAASFGETGLFNEITAQYREETDGQGIWRLELRLANVRDTEVSKSSYVLLNPAESADTKVEKLTKAQAVREAFDQRMRTAMRSFADQVFRIPNEDRDKKTTTDLLSDAMRPFESMIRDTIFAGFTTRSRLILKNVEPIGLAPTLTEQYTTFSGTDDADPLLYPASIAAWSLILGRPLCYPHMKDLSTTPADHDWILRSQKIHSLLSALQWLIQQDMERSSPHIGANSRFENMHKALQWIQNNPIEATKPAPKETAQQAPEDATKQASKETAQQASKETAQKDSKDAAQQAPKMAVMGEDMYQPPLAVSMQKEYPYFICVPYPMRPLTGIASPLPEIAVLEVGVLGVNPSNGEQLSAEAKENDNYPFTKEHIEMLECLMDLVGLTLTTANALGKPKGNWDKRP